MLTPIIKKVLKEIIGEYLKPARNAARLVNAPTRAARDVERLTRKAADRLVGEIRAAKGLITKDDLNNIDFIKSRLSPLFEDFERDFNTLAQNVVADNNRKKILKREKARKLSVKGKPKAGKKTQSRKKRRSETVIEMIGEAMRIAEYIDYLPDVLKKYRARLMRGTLNKNDNEAKKYMSDVLDKLIDRNKEYLFITGLWYHN